MFFLQKQLVYKSKGYKNAGTRNMERLNNEVGIFGLVSSSSVLYQKYAISFSPKEV